MFKQLLYKFQQKLKREKILPYGRSGKNASLDGKQ